MNVPTDKKQKDIEEPNIQKGQKEIAIDGQID